MSNSLATLFAKRFIQRRDVKAVQFSSGAFVPDRELKNLGQHGPLGWTMDHLNAHLEGRATYGHYLIDHDNLARCFVIDIDLKKEGFWCSMPPFGDAEVVATPCNLRETWLDRSQIEARQWLKTQMNSLAHRLCGLIRDDSLFGCAAAYSGSKGIHIYGFLKEGGSLPAHQLRDAAIDYIDQTEEWQLIRGKNLWTHVVEDPFLGYQNYTIEVFPKQHTLDGKDLGNLVRLPLGRNLKSEDPTFFLDLTGSIGDFRPHPNPVQLLETGDPYAS